MKYIYENISNSILNYLLNKGHSAKCNYYIIRIHYYNILGDISSINILKTLTTGDKIISTIKTTKKSKSKSNIKSSILQLKTKRQNKNIDYKTTHSKLGLITHIDWNKILVYYSNLIKSKLNIFTKYCESYKNITNSTPFFIYNTVNLPNSKNEIIGDKFVLHGGCEYIKMQIEHTYLSSKKQINITPHFLSVYQLFHNGKNILHIKNCDDLEIFIKKYNTIKNNIDWSKIMLDYEGILVENIKYTNINKKINYKKIVLDILAENNSIKKISTDEIKNIKYHLFKKKLSNIGYVWKIKTSKFVKII